jgi:dipeptidyl aminopeptidase/acylaminoacyl peptidase
MKSNLYSILLILIYSLTSTAQKSTFRLDDIDDLTRISSLEISSDGEHALYMTSKRNFETNTFDRSLIAIEITSKKQRILGSDIKGKGSPKWLKSGRSISLIANGENGRQVFNYDIKSEILTQITSSETGINTSVWIVSASGKDAQKITPDGFTVATNLTTSTLSWSPDSKMIAFTKYPTAFSGDSDLGRNYIYSLETKELSQATQNTERESSPTFTPDSKSLVYRYPRDGFPSNMNELHLMNLETGTIENLGSQLNKSTSGIAWLSDVEMVLRATEKFGNALFRVKDSKALKINTSDLASVSSWSMSDNGKVVFTATKRNYPVEIYFKSDLDADPIQLTAYNEFVSKFNLGQQETMEWESSDDLKPNGIITYPPDFDSQRTYPLVLLIHGGPSASSLLGFNAVAQAMAAKGWIIFQPNYRGSTNLGNEFQSAISKDPSEGPGNDVITGVRMLIEKPYIDSEKICVSGWSYGGWMTSWLIGRYPDMWAAAVAGAAPVDFTDMYSLNDLNRMKRHSIIESPYIGENLDWAYSNSPISNFSKIKAPTLIMSKTGDYRVTITGSYKLYGALRDNDIPVQFIAYPGPGHFPRDPVRSKDVYTRWISWIEKYVGSTEAIEGMDR